MKFKHCSTILLFSLFVLFPFAVVEGASELVTPSVSQVNTANPLFILGNMVWNGGVLAFVGWLIRRWITNVDENFKIGRKEAEDRARGFQESLDKIEGCVTLVKVDLAGKVDKLEHDHFCYKKTQDMWAAIRSTNGNP